MYVFDDNISIYEKCRILRKQNHLFLRNINGRGCAIIKKDEKFDGYNVFINGSFLYMCQTAASAIKFAIFYGFNNYGIQFIKWA